MATKHPAQARTCSRCGRDCSPEPPGGDRHGPSMCSACAAQAKGPEPRLDPIPLADDALPPVPPGGAIPLADDPLPLAPPPPPPPPPLLEGPSTARCPRCGYDVRGLRQPRCPECGSVLTRGEVRRILDEASERAIRRYAYLRPSVLAGVFAALLGVTLFLRYGAEGVLALLAGLSGGTLAAMLVYLGCGVLFLGFDAPMRLVAVQLAAVVAVTSFAYAICGWLPSILLAYAVPAFACMWMMHRELDLDHEDAALAGFPTAAAIFGVWIAVADLVL